MNKLLRTLVILCLSLCLFLSISWFLIYSVKEASAGIYWGDSTVSDSFFFDKLLNLGYKAVFGGPVVLNGENGHFAVFRINGTIPEIGEQIKNRFAQLHPDDVIVGNGSKADFIVAKCGPRTFASMLIRDDNINSTWLFVITMPTKLFHKTNSSIDEAGMDPVQAFRPPGSQRVFCFETPSIALAAYKSIDRNLADFYESKCASDGIRAASVMAFTDAKLPNNGNIFFFDSYSDKGFVVYQSSPKDNCSYAIVCSQPQKQP